MKRFSGFLLALYLALLVTAPEATFAAPGDFADSGQALGNVDTLNVALGDIDRDGDLDAFVTHFSRPSEIYLNDGAGTFSNSAQAIGAPTAPFGIALGDLDGDEDLDAFVQDPGDSKVWLNDGSGTFSDSGQTLVSGSVSAVALGDLDGDGDLDAFASNRGSDRVWLNNGAGIFTDSGQAIGAESSNDVALGDLDGDGDLDAFVAIGEPLATSGQSNKVWFNNGNGTFSNSEQVIGTADSRAVSLGDLDGDGDLDAFVANSNYDGQPDKVWLNDGTGTFYDSGQAFEADHTMDVSLGDLDGDGDLDAFLVKSGTTLVWLNDGFGIFTPGRQVVGVQYAGSKVALGDLDGDCDLDAFLVISASLPDSVLINNDIAPPPVATYTPATGTMFFNDVRIDGTVKSFQAQLARVGFAGYLFTLIATTRFTGGGGCFAAILDKGTGVLDVPAIEILGTTKRYAVKMTLQPGGGLRFLLTAVTKL